MALGVGAAAATAVVAYGAWRMIDDRYARGKPGAAPRLQLASDADYLLRFSRTVRELAALEREGFNTARLFLRTAARFPDKAAVVYERRSVTFRELDDMSNRVAHWATTQGLGFGDCVALFMENRPEFITWWLGFTKLGVRIALLNTTLRSGAAQRAQGLLHCVNLVKPLWLIAGTELAGTVRDAEVDLARSNIAVGFVGHAGGLTGTLDAAVASQPSTPQATAVVHRATMTDIFGYVYTSGTTGLPKAAIMPHWRVVGYAATFVNNWRIVPADRIYCALPLYHSAGGLGGVGMMLYAGATLVVARRFSATRFWEEVSVTESTIIQYIGELCRYLLATPPSPYDRQHHVRIAIGGGLRADIWEAFQTRFAIPEIGELYGSTEGNVSLMNHARTPQDRGACGRQGWLLRQLLGGRIVQFNVETGDVRRDPRGFCIECGPGEVGELIGPIKAATVSRFEGYTDAAATAKKILENAFLPGDRYFRSGDLFVRDRQGYFRFVDRIGDTFRWKGQNVSTTEVEHILTSFQGVLEANVYGVAVPGTDGQACMAACVLADDVDWDGLYRYLKKQLPEYAIPIFVRVLPKIEVTATFRHTKVALRREGFNPSQKDAIYWLNTGGADGGRAGGRYVQLDAGTYDTILAGKARL